jgi:hypothetical protein
MIPALLAVPLVQGVVGGVVGSVMNCFAPSTPPPTAPTSGSTSSFSQELNSAAATSAAPRLSLAASPTGTLRANEWGQMAPADVKSWMTGLAGKHVTATDETGKTISGVVGGMQQLGNTLALNIGGHLVSLSQLTQISWSPSTV